MTRTSTAISIGAAIFLGLDPCRAFTTSGTAIRRFPPSSGRPFSIEMLHQPALRMMDPVATAAAEISSSFSGVGATAMIVGESLLDPTSSSVIVAATTAFTESATTTAPSPEAAWTAVLLLATTTEPWVQPAVFVLDAFLNIMSVAMLARVVLSWYPEVKISEMPWLIVTVTTEPLLRAVKGFVPPAFGVDITPVFWVAVFTFVHEILLGQQGLLTLKIKYGI